MCHRGRAQWCQLANTIELVLLSAHSNSQPKRQIDRFSRVSSGMPEHVLSPNNCPFAWGIWASSSNTCFLGSTRVLNPTGISIGSAVFVQLTAERHYTLQRATLGASKLPLPMGDLQLHPIHDFLAHPSPQPKRHLDRFSHFCTAQRRVSLYFTMDRPFSAQNCPFPWGGSGPHLIRGCLGPPESSTQTASRSFALFCRTH